MNTSYNYSDFIGLSLESNEDYEPYGYDMEALEAVELAQSPDADLSFESAMHARNIEKRYFE